MLFQGAQATGGGYFMYGVSIYPGAARDPNLSPARPAVPPATRTFRRHTRRCRPRPEASLPPPITPFPVARRV